ncbi:hypothetical protein IU501_07180 [Nocardia otitidiscaviarum]|nr:hypothetical protein [Nocardia otitidiscaviarum]MBF6132784.1 hypothetical protein [Nocardia otitidiscaviarum]MBF6486203.1 hypothetical protein [Nocardia otitidiscaviarum]
MPEMACTLLVVFGFLTAALCLRVLAGATATRRVRVARVPRRDPHAMMRR